jgi:hypothetical protein
MDVWRISNFKQAHQMEFTIRSRLSHPTRSLSRIGCGGQEGPQGRKSTSGLISRPIIDQAFLNKANVHTRNRKEVVSKSRYN